MRQTVRSAAAALVVAHAVVACEERPSVPAPSAPPSAAAPIASASAPALAPAVGAGVQYSSTALATKDKWLVVSQGGSELALLELRAGKPGVLQIQAEDSAAVADLNKRWEKLRSPAGIPVKMHLPPEDGKGRGPLGERVFKPGDADYAMAVEQELEPAFDVEVVPAAVTPEPPKTFRLLTVVRDGMRVGSIDFSTSPAKLKVDTEKSDGDFLKSDFELLSKAPMLRVRYVRADGGIGTLVTEAANKGEPAYARVFLLSLVLRRQYDAQRAYVLGVE